MSKIDEVRSDARERSQRFRAQEGMGFVVGALASGALGPQGKNLIPQNVLGPIDTDTGLGLVAFLYSRRGNTKKHAYARGFAAQALASGFRDLGASMASRW